MFLEKIIEPQNRWWNCYIKSQDENLCTVQFVKFELWVSFRDIMKWRIQSFLKETTFSRGFHGGCDSLKMTYFCLKYTRYNIGWMFQKEIKLILHLNRLLTRTLSIFEFQFSFSLIWGKIFASQTIAWSQNTLNMLLQGKVQPLYMWILIIQITPLRMTAPLRKNHILNRQLFT